MLLRNIDQQNGHCNETRLKVLRIGDHVIEVQMIAENNIGHKNYIPRMRLILSDKGCHLNFIEDNSH